uniref:Uncharacterized protein n=1 Tax=Anopheles culicifacies TaxID=139723 RepID=A0A182LUM0_9DIPT
MELRQPGQPSSSPSCSSYQRPPPVGSNHPPPPDGGDVLLLSRSCPITVRIRRKCLANLPSIREKLSAIFGIQLQEVFQHTDDQQYQQQQFITFQVLDETSGCQVAVGSALSGSIVSSGSGDLIGQIQRSRASQSMLTTRICNGLNAFFVPYCHFYPVAGEK